MYIRKQKTPQASWKVGYGPQEKTIARMAKAIRRWVHALPMDNTRALNIPHAPPALHAPGSVFNVLKLPHFSTAALSFLVLCSTTVVWGSDVHISLSDSDTAPKTDSLPQTNSGGAVFICFSDTALKADSLPQTNFGGAVYACFSDTALKTDLLPQTNSGGAVYTYLSDTAPKTDSLPQTNSGGVGHTCFSGTAPKTDSLPQTNSGGVVYAYPPLFEKSLGALSELENGEPFLLQDSETQALENGDKPPLKNCESCLEQCEHHLSW